MDEVVSLISVVSSFAPDVSDGLLVVVTSVS